MIAAVLMTITLWCVTPDYAQPACPTYYRHLKHISKRHVRFPLYGRF